MTLARKVIIGILVIWAVAWPEQAGSALNGLNSFFLSNFTTWYVLVRALFVLVCILLALGYFVYRRGLPLTIRSSLTPLFGQRLSGGLGHMIDIVAVVATILGVAQTLGFGVNQFVGGLSRIGVGAWLMTAEGRPSAAGIISAITIIMVASTLAALSGVGKGIKWLSNMNMGLSIFLLKFFLIFGVTIFGLWALFVGTWDYVISLPGMMFTVYQAGTEVDDALVGVQGAWTVF